MPSGVTCLDFKAWSPVFWHTRKTIAIQEIHFNATSKGTFALL
jgi:hypothetical protein